MTFKRVFFILSTYIVAVAGRAQNNDLQLPHTIESLRAEQLAGNDSNTQPSLTVLPQMKWGDKKNNASFLPVVFIQQFNTNYPFGWNDGGMIPAKGYQTLVSTGFHVKYKIIDIKFKPEFIYACNNNFDTLRGYNLRGIDYPEKFGNSPYHKFRWGQSHIALNYKKLSLNLSTENLWWGPGIKNSIVLSNNAAGFPHLSFNTTEPIQNFLGGWEFQLISGFLASSGFYPNYYNSFHPSGKDKRYFNAVIITYQPKWIKNFYIGAIRGYDQYWDDAKKNSDYMPVFANLFRKNDKGGSSHDDLLNRDQIASLFFRYVFKKSRFEIYGEYGREDASYNLRDFLQTPEHCAAYIFGFQKAFLLPQAKSKLFIQSEFTHLEQTIDYSVRNGGFWYVNWQVQHGWTNEGKILGAGIGPGNCRNIAITFSSNEKNYGLNLMQIDRNNDMYYSIFSSTPSVNRKWADNVFELYGSFQLKKNKNFYFIWNADYIRTRDRYWLLNDYPVNDINAKTKYSNNFQFKIATVYHF